MCKIVDKSVFVRYSIFCSKECKTKYAIVVQLVVRHLAKVEVAGSSPVCRSELTVCNVFFVLINYGGADLLLCRKEIKLY